MIRRAVPAMRRFVAQVALLLAFAGVQHVAFAQATTGSPTVEVTGLVDRPATFTVDDLRALPARDVAIDTTDARRRTYRGVLLKDVLAACRLTETGRFDLRRSFFVVHATDGYLGVFSWAEVFNTAVGDEVLVAYALDGMPLGAEGPLALVSGRDLRSGPRHVRWLQSIDVRRAS